MSKQATMLAVLWVLTASSVLPQNLPRDFIIKNAASGKKFSLPVGIAFAPGNRIFVTEKGGRVYVIQDGEKIANPFIDLGSEVLSNESNGLLGIAVDPDFENNRWVYLLYTVDPTGGQDNDIHGFSRLTRYQAKTGNLNEADLSTRQILIGTDWGDGIIACGLQHVIGTVRFGTDGTLFVGAGEASLAGTVDAGGGHPECFGEDRFSQDEDVGAFRSQYLKSLAGKILRIDPETGGGLPSNPYYTGNPDDKQSKVWAYGLRNPFRFNVRPNGSTNPADGNPGSVYIGDVGWGTWEDLNVSRVGGGENFGWPCFEGPNALSAYQRKNPDHSGCTTIGTAENPAEHTPPSVYWHHTNANQSSPSGFIGASVTAGPFYTGTKYPRDYWNVNFFADFEQGWIKVLEVDDDDNVIEVRDFAQFSGGRFEHGIVDLETDPLTGNVFYVDITKGTVNEIRYTGATVNQDPIAIANADTLFGHAPLTVHFKGSDSFDPDNDDLSFSWNFGNGDTSTRADPVYTYQQNGTFEVKLTVEDENRAKSSFFLPQIIVGSLPPSVTILQPGTNASAFANETVLLNGTAADPDEPESNLQYSWVVDLHHNDHVHPASFQVPGKSGSIVPADHGDPWDLIYLKLTLRVTDSSGLTGVDTAYVVMKAPGEADITHRGTPIALITNPSGNGNPNIGVINDNVFPPAGSSNPLQQYDTNTGGGARSQDWIGYEFNSTQRFARLIFQEGIHFADGGWFEFLAVQVRDNGSWREVHFLNSVPPYPGNNGVNYELSSLLFSPENGDAIRIIGAPGGSNPFISVGELRVFDSPFGEPAIFQPTDDTRVRANRPDRNYGEEAELHAETTARMSFLKFNVTGVSSQVTRATLQLHAVSGTDDGGEMFLVSNNHVNSSTPWDEEGLTFNNAPPIAGSALNSNPGKVTSGDVVEFDVTEAVTGDGIYSFALQNNSSDRAEYSSKEGFHTPELIVITGGGEAGHFDLFVTELGNGTVEVSPAGQQHDAGTVVQLTARPAAGWTFSHWVGDLTGSDNPAEITMDRDKSITAVFDEVPEETTFTFTPIHDGQVKVTQPGKNYGTKGTAKVTLNKFLSFFKFEVTGLDVAVENARLRFHVVGSSEDGGALYSVSNNFLVGGTPWIESILSFSNAPQITGPPVGNLGRVTAGTYVEVDVSSVVSGNGTYSFAIKNQLLDEAKYETREGNFPPELIIETEPGHNPVTASDWVAHVDWDETTVVTMNMVESGAALSFSPNQLTFEAGKPYILKIVNPATNVSKHYFATREVFPDFYKAIATRKIQTADAEYKAPYFRGVELLIGGELDIYFVPVLAGTYDFLCTIPGHAIAGMVGQITIRGGQGFELDLEVDSQFNMGLTTDARTSGSHEVWATAQDLTVQMVENADATLSFDPADLNLTEDSGYTINLVNPAGNTSKHYYTAPEFYKTVVTRKAQDSNAEIKVVYFRAIELLTGGATELFMVSTLTGAYDVFCTIPGHKDRGMMGTITVESQAGPWTLAVTTQGTGSIDLNPPGGEYLDGTVVQVTAVPGSGWQFSRWSGELSGNANPITLTMNSNKQVTAIFEQSGGGTGLVFHPVHDGQVKVTRPGKNYGAKGTTKVKAGTFLSFFKFEVAGLTSAVKRARLRLYVAGNSVDGGAVYLVSNNFSVGGTPWLESLLSFSNAPQITGAPVGNLGSVTAGTFAEVDVTSVVAGNGTFSFGIQNGLSDEAKYETKEGTFPPELILETDDGGGHGPFHLIVTSQGGGSVSLTPPGGAYDEGTSVQLSANPDPGWEFSGWRGDLSGTANPAILTMSSDKNVTAIFVQSGGNGGLTFHPTHDGQVKVTAPLKNYGTKTTSKVEMNKFRSFFKFEVSGLTSAVRAARLRLYVAGNSADGGTVYLVSNDFSGGGGPWTEQILNFGNAPGLDGSPVGVLGKVTAGTFAELDVTSVIAGNGTYSFGIKNNHGDQAMYDTKEGSFAPQLVVEADSGAPEQFHLTITQQGAGSVTLNPPGGVYTDGTPVQLTAVPDFGWEFNSWNGDLSGAANPVPITMNSDKSVTAIFSEQDPGENTFTFEPIEDAYVRSTRATRNYGQSTDLTVKNSTATYRSFLKFNVTNLVDPVKQATLHLYVTDQSSKGGEVYSVSNSYKNTSTPWDEHGITWTNAPDIGGVPLSSLGPVNLGDWVQMDITPAISGNGVFSFSVHKPSGGKVVYSSKEGSHAPRLVVETDPDARGGNQPPVAGDDNASTSPGIPLVLIPTANDFDPDGALDPTSLVVTDTPDHGSLTVNPFSAIVTYIPNAGFAGSDSFAYTIADNEGATSNEATVTITVGTTSASLISNFRPVEQRQVEIPSGHAGRPSTFSLTTTTRYQTYLKFKVARLEGRIHSARLHLIVGDRRSGTGMVYLASNTFAHSLTPWSGLTLDTRNLPEISDAAIGAFGSVASGTLVEVDVSAAITGEGTYSFAVDNNLFVEGEDADAPRLIIALTSDLPSGESDVLSKTEKSTDRQLLESAGPVIPKTLSLSPGYPNPFNAETTIRYALPQDAKVRILIYNLRGQLVSTLVDDFQAAGFKKIRWFGKNDAGLDVSSGVYFVRMRVGKQRLAQKMTLQK